MMKTTMTMLLGAALAVPGFAAENLLGKAEVKAHPYPEKTAEMLDGNFETQWMGYTVANSDGKITATFPEETEFQTVAVHGGNLVSGTVELSPDGVAWEAPAAMSTANAPGMLGLSLDKPRKNKALRLALSGGPEKLAVVVRELYAFVPDVPENLATLRRITESGGDRNWRFPAVCLVDGNTATGTKYYSNYSGSAFEVDLGKEETVSSVEFRGGAPFARMTVSVSADGKSWTQKAEKSNAAKGVPLTFAPAGARHVKIDVKGSFTSAPNELIIR